jgi:acyl-CoA thioester hydrolase
MVETSFRVRYYETDAMGIVHHSNYLRWFELGRTEYLRAVNLTYRALEDRGIGSPVIGFSCRYHHPARYDDAVTVLTWVQDYDGIRLSMGYSVSCDGQILCRGRSEHAFVFQKRAVAPVRSLPDVHAVLCECRQLDQVTAEQAEEDYR